VRRSFNLVIFDEIRVKTRSVVSSRIYSLPEGHRIYGLTQQALGIRHQALSCCSLSYELYVSMLWKEADSILKSLDPVEASFFIRVLGDDYVRPEDRDPDTPSEMEIRRELSSLLYGDPDDP